VAYSLLSDWVANKAPPPDEGPPAGLNL
jgi:hypothetical protein